MSKKSTLRRSIDFDRDLYEKLKQNAAYNRRSVQFMVTFILEEYLKKPNKKSKRPMKFF